MNKKKLTRIIAVCMACLGMGLLTFAGCKKNPENNGGDQNNTQGGQTGTGDNQTGTGGNQTGSGDNQTGTGDNKPGTGGNEKPSGSGEQVKEPEISGPVKGGPKNVKASSQELETAYVTWEAADNAKWYNVYYSPAGADNWVKLDDPLVRQYSTYYRADALGLKAGNYDMKIVPVSGDDKEATDCEAKATGINVKAHAREGYAFVGNTSTATASGAYNMDGTLKSDAIVLYVTNENWQTVSVTYGSTTITGIDNILGEGYQAKKGATKPLCVRIVGSIGSGSKLSMKAGGDLEMKGLDQGVTIEGVGNDATGNGWGLHVTSSSNVEIRNLAFMEMQGTTKDGVSIESKCHHIWVHNCDFFYGHNWGGDQKKGDGSLDTKGSTNITHSYNHFWDSGKCNLQGMEKATDTGVYQITYHHNWYDHSDSRHPRIRRATVHIYNNYFDGNAKYGVGVTNGASAFVENNYFRSTGNMKPMLSSMQGTDIAHGKDGQTFSGENGGMIKAFGNVLDGKYELLTQTTTDADNLDCYLASSRTEQVPSTYTTKQGGTTYNNFDTESGFYTYSVETPETAKANVERYAGRIDGGDLKYEFDNATQDKNYDIIPELSQLITNYSKTITLVKIGGAASTTGGGTTGGQTGTGETPGSGEDDNPVSPPSTIVGEIKFVPSESGSGFTVTGNKDSNSTAVTVDGVDVPARSALKMESSTSVTFTTTQKMTLTLYLSVASIKVDGKNITTGTDAFGLKAITVEIEVGSHTIEKKDKASLYLIKLTPVS